MKFSGNFRKQLGLTQQQLADFVGTHRTALTRAESGERSLSTGAVPLLAVMQEFAGSFSESRGVSVALSPDFKKELAHQALFCRQTYTRLQKKLQMLQTAETAARRLVHLLDLLEKRPPYKLSRKQQRWLEEQRYQAGKKLDGCGPEAQVRLKIKMELLLAEAELCEREAAG